MNKIQLTGLNNDPYYIFPNEIIEIKENSWLSKNPITNELNICLGVQPNSATVVKFNRSNKDMYLRVKETKKEIEELCDEN